MSRRQEVTEAIYSLLKEEIQEVEWSTAFSGVKRTQEITGTINCDRISFALDSKNEREAIAKYSISVYL